MGWVRSKGGKEVSNLELVQEAYALLGARPGVTGTWIRGHAGSTWNEYADTLAEIARREQ